MVSLSFCLDLYLFIKIHAIYSSQGFVHVRERITLVAKVYATIDCTICCTTELTACVWENSRIVGYAYYDSCCFYSPPCMVMVRI